MKSSQFIFCLFLTTLIYNCQDKGIIKDKNKYIDLEKDDIMQEKQITEKSERELEYKKYNESFKKLYLKNRDNIYKYKTYLTFEELITIYEKNIIPKSIKDFYEYKDLELVENTNFKKSDLLQNTIDENKTNTTKVTQKTIEIEKNSISNVKLLEKLPLKTLLFDLKKEHFSSCETNGILDKNYRILIDMRYHDNKKFLNSRNVRVISGILFLGNIFLLLHSIHLYKRYGGYVYYNASKLYDDSIKYETEDECKIQEQIEYCTIIDKSESINAYFFLLVTFTPFTSIFFYILMDPFIYYTNKFFLNCLPSLCIYKKQPREFYKEENPDLYFDPTYNDNRCKTLCCKIQDPEFPGTGRMCFGLLRYPNSFCGVTKKVVKSIFCCFKNCSMPKFLKKNEDDVKLSVVIQEEEDNLLEGEVLEI